MLLAQRLLKGMLWHESGRYVVRLVGIFPQKANKSKQFLCQDAKIVTIRG